MKSLIIKNKSLCVFLLLLMVSIFIILILNNSSKDKYDAIYVDDLNIIEKPDLQIMLINSDNLLECVAIKSIDLNCKNIYEKIFAIYNEYQNSLPINYTSPFNKVIFNREIYVIGDKILIDIEKKDYELDIEKAAKCLMWSYQLLGIEELEISIGKSKFSLNKDTIVNEVVLSESGKQQIIFVNTDCGFIPYTFYHNNNSLEFILDMLLIDSYDIKYINGVINIYTDNALTNNIKKCLDLNMEYLNIDKYNIIEK